MPDIDGQLTLQNCPERIAPESCNAGAGVSHDENSGRHQVRHLSHTRHNNELNKDHGPKFYIQSHKILRRYGSKSLQYWASPTKLDFIKISNANVSRDGKEK